MKIVLTCFKQTGKYYSSRESEVPEMNTWELREYVLNNPDCWPTHSIDGFYVLVQPEPDDDGVPLLMFPEKRWS